MRIWGSQRSQYRLFRQILLRLALLFVCSPILASFCRLVPWFTALYVRHIQQRINILTRESVRIRNPLAFVHNKRMSVGESHEHGRTTFAYEYPMRI
jgi:hypothetical protein